MTFNWHNPDEILAYIDARQSSKSELDYEDLLALLFAYEVAAWLQRIDCTERKSCAIEFEIRKMYLDYADLKAGGHKKYEAADEIKALYELAKHPQRHESVVQTGLTTEYLKLRGKLGLEYDFHQNQLHDLERIYNDFLHHHAAMLLSSEYADTAFYNSINYLLKNDDLLSATEQCAAATQRLQKQIDKMAAVFAKRQCANTPVPRKAITEVVGPETDTHSQSSAGSAELSRMVRSPAMLFSSSSLSTAPSASAHSSDQACGSVYEDTLSMVDGDVAVNSVLRANRSVLSRFKAFCGRATLRSSLRPQNRQTTSSRAKAQS